MGAFTSEHPDAPGALLAEASLFHAYGAIANAGIGCAVIKGIPLARLLYGKVDARGVPADTDLLVRHSDAPAAVDALLAAGYSSPYLPVPKEWLTGAWKVVLRRRIERDVTATVELHWAPFSPRTFPLAEELVWRHIREAAFSGKILRVPDRELTLLLLACHFCQSGLVTGRILDDFAIAWNSWGAEVDLATLGSLVAEARAGAAFSITTRAARQRGLFNSPHPDIASIQADLVARWIQGGREVPAPDSGTDYRGQLAALAVTAPARLPIEILRAAIPSRLGMAVATERPLPGIDGYLSLWWARMLRMISGLTPPRRSERLPQRAVAALSGRSPG